MNSRKLTGHIIDSRNRGIAGVPVSNGETFCISDRTGSFSLPADPERHPFVFVTTPGGWRVDGRSFKTVEAWMGGDRSFRLLPFPGSRRCSRFAVITDLHLVAGRRDSVRRLRADLSLLCRASAGNQFVLATGDLTQDGNGQSLDAVARIFQDAGHGIVYPVFGGHDGREECKVLKRPLPWARQYMQRFGPAWYSFDRGQWHFAVFANEDHHFTLSLNAAKGRWLEEDLKNARDRGLHRVVAVHAPPTPEFSRRLSRLGVSLMVCGHWHTLKRWSVGKTQFICQPPLNAGGIDMMPRGSLQVRVTKSGNCAVRYRAAGMPENRARRGSRLWMRQLGRYGHRASPILVDDRLLAIAQRDSQEGTDAVVCLDANSGRTIWKTKLSGAVKHSIVVAGQRMLVNTQQGELVCLQVERGKVLWKARLHEYPHRWLHGAPVVVNETIVAGTGRGGFDAFHISDGRMAWSIPPLPGKPTVRGDVWPSSAAPVGFGDSIVAPVHGVGLMRIGAKSGKVLWRAELPFYYYMPALILNGASLWCPPAEESADFLEVDVGSGVVRRRIFSGSVPIAWARHEGRIFIAATRRVSEGAGLLQCRATDDVSILWQKPTGRSDIGAYHYARRGPNVLATPVIAGDLVYLSCDDGTIRIHDVNRGNLIRRISVGSPLFSSPIVQDSRIWVQDWHGQMICLNH